MSLQVLHVFAEDRHDGQEIDGVTRNPFTR